MPWKYSESSFSFNRCNQLKNITIPKSVKTIGQGTIFGYSSLANITTIESQVFYEMNIPMLITQISKGTMKLCKSLSKITIPKSIIIDSYSFSECSILTNISIENP